MNLIDSSAWLEYFAKTKNARNFSQAIEDIDHLLVPTICLLEVFKKLLQDHNESIALRIIAHMKQGKLAEPNSSLAFEAALLGKEYKLPLADSIVYATAKAHDATVWTQDADFKGLPGVRYFPKKT